MKDQTLQRTGFCSLLTCAQRLPQIALCAKKMGVRNSTAEYPLNSNMNGPVRFSFSFLLPNQQESKILHSSIPLNCAKQQYMYIYFRSHDL